MKNKKKKGMDKPCQTAWIFGSPVEGFRGRVSAPIFRRSLTDLPGTARSARETTGYDFFDMPERQQVTSPSTCPRVLQQPSSVRESSFVFKNLATKQIRQMAREASSRQGEHLEAHCRQGAPTANTSGASSMYST